MKPSPYTESKVNSTCFYDYTYEKESETLKVTFMDGRTYRYSEITDKVYSEFADAPSKGRYFISTIKENYPSEKM